MGNQLDKPKGKPRGRKGGRKPSPTPHKRINIYLSLIELDLLKQLDNSPSQAIRTLLNMVFTHKEKQT